MCMYVFRLCLASDLMIGLLQIDFQDKRRRAQSISFQSQILELSSCSRYRREEKRKKKLIKLNLIRGRVKVDRKSW